MSGAGFGLSIKTFSSVKKCQFKIVDFDSDLMMTSLTLYGTHFMEVVTVAKLDACTRAVLLEELTHTFVHTYIHTYRQILAFLFDLASL